MAKSIHISSYQNLVRSLVDARLVAGLTQQTVADRLLKPQSYVAKVEGLERRIDVIEFFDFAQAIDCDPIPILEEIWQERNKRKWKR